MRVVAGRFRGRRLRAPAGSAIRPTSDRVREAVFQILGPLDGLSVLDLFAGSGALGIEALSRGAAQATFVDNDARAVAAVRQNLAPLDADSVVVKRDALDYLGSGGGPFDLVFIDPPYDLAARFAAPLSARLPRIAAKDARLVTESDKRSPLLLSLPLLDERVYGSTRVAFHAAATEPPEEPARGE